MDIRKLEHRIMSTNKNTEDYVSFETAKLLKEKGFDEICYTAYETITNAHEVEQCSISNWGRLNQVKRPTLQMAMKWLRKVHNIDIEVRTHYLSHLKQNDVRYYSGKILKGSEDVIHTIYSKDTYEEVCELAIKYSLENLI